MTRYVSHRKLDQLEYILRERLHHSHVDTSLVVDCIHALLAADENPNDVFSKLMTMAHERAADVTREDAHQ